MATVEDRSGKTVKPTITRTHQAVKSNRSHQVKVGDTLYSIGFKYQLDYKLLAQYNNIPSPYRIYPNQILRLTVDPRFNKQKNKTTKTTPIKINQPITSKPITNNKPLKTPTKPIKKPVAVKPTVKKQAKSTTVKLDNNKTLNWLKPTKGQIRTTFLASNPARKGISISGKEGQDVVAAEAGVVVYSGNGLLGYGELIIIKHNDVFLSAYGHNKTRFVEEGTVVKRGQRIAELGSSGTNINNLHFEIRKSGAPVNPLKYIKQ
ncbi:MAG: peptidoglycan DD-metalloendopeptidase family protein [Proteobacteria bacterium]|nr:peptidoglycan DD-metalloendopeptidase family protein [Pseudomonadota bacterium]